MTEDSVNDYMHQIHEKAYGKKTDVAQKPQNFLDISVAKNAPSTTDLLMAKAFGSLQAKQEEIEKQLGFSLRLAAREKTNQYGKPATEYIITPPPNLDFEQKTRFARVIF